MSSDTHRQSQKKFRICHKIAGLVIDSSSGGSVDAQKSAKMYHGDIRYPGIQDHSKNTGPKRSS